MEHYAGIDVSLDLSSVCVVDTQGKIVKEAKVASAPEGSSRQAQRQLFWRPESLGDITTRPADDLLGVPRFRP